MQIYEIMQPRSKPITEINLAGAVKSIGAAAKTAAKALPQAAISAAGQYLEKQSGIQGLAALAQPDANPYAGAAAKDKAMAAVGTVSKPQAKQQKALFDKALSQLMAEKGVTNAANLQQSDTKALSQNLFQQINQNLLAGRLDDFADLPSMIKAGQPQQQANDIVKRINDAMTKLQDVATYSVTKPMDQELIWQQLTQAAGEALVMMQFDNKMGSPGGYAAPPAAASPAANAAVQKMAQTAAAGRLTAQQLGINQSQIRNFQSKFPPGTNPRLDGLFQAIGLYPTP
jgi:hypothetical protein